MLRIDKHKLTLFDDASDDFLDTFRLDSATVYYSTVHLAHTLETYWKKY